MANPKDLGHEDHDAVGTTRAQTTRQDGSSSTSRWRKASRAERAVTKMAKLKDFGQDDHSRDISTGRWERTRECCLREQSQQNKDDQW